MRAQAGYTLVELLIVMALLGILSTLLVSGLQLGAQVWEISEQRGIDLGKTALAQKRLRHSIANAYPVFPAGARPTPHIVFEGKSHELSFLAFDPDASTAGRNAITIGVSAAEGRNHLVFRSAPELIAADASGRTLSILVSNVQSVVFSYLGETGGVWVSEWREQKRLPRLVRIQVTFAAGDPRRWPELIVAPRVHADVACRFDSVTQSCAGL